MDGISIIKEQLKSLPEAPGIYKMLNKKQQILYIGKAKNLLKRLASYTNPNKLSERIYLMVGQINSLEIITTDTEVEALLLEANLIKSLKPKYNILLKDDKSFPYILIRKDHEYSQILKHRGPKKLEGRYFGPYLSVNAVNETVDILQKIFKLRSCSDSYFASRKRPCLQYQIKKCSAPCVSYITKEEYQKLVRQAYNFLEGKSNLLQTQLSKEMEDASNKLQFEKAAEIRDKIRSLNKIQSMNNNVTDLGNIDAIAIDKSQAISCIQVFVYRDNQNLGNKTYFFENTEDFIENEILATFLAQFYQNNTVPKEVITNIIPNDKKNLEQAFNTKIIIPKTGRKHKVITWVFKNAQDAIQRKITRKQQYIKILKDIANLFNINKTIKRIEVFDNSHISGQHAIGAMIVAGEEGFLKKHYRTFNIQTSKVGDDYSMLKEVLTRRYKKLLIEYPEYQEEKWPDLILIDGGPGQLSIARKVFKKLKLNINFISIAKGEKRNAGFETFYLPDNHNFTLNNNDPRMQYLQNLRDEAHRFAITKHRNKRSKSIITSSIIDIPGIGEKRKKSLLKHFGSFAEIKGASIEELAKVEGINNKTAQIIYNAIRNK